MMASMIDRSAGANTDQRGGAPRVVVVVLNYCNEEITADCLSSLADSTYAAQEVLVVDNASPDGSGARLRARFPAVHHLTTSHNGGYTAGNNRGFEWVLARGDVEYVVVLNNDTIVDPHCIERLVAAAQETGAAAVAPLMLYYDEPNIVWYAGGSVSHARIMGKHLGENEPMIAGRPRMPVSFICGCCFLLRVDVLRAIGGFDERFFAYGEDLELSIRLARGGYVMLHEPAATLLHRISRTSPLTAAKIRLRDQNRRRIARRHYGWLARARFAAWFYPTRLIHLMRYAAAGRWAEARAQLDGAFHPISESSDRH
jgi:GT2 family glycosyltransferase